MANNQAMEERQERKIMGISIGDPNGVGIELILKVFQDKRMFDFFTPVVFANTKLMSAQLRHFDLQTPLLYPMRFWEKTEPSTNIVEAFKQPFDTTFGEATEAGKLRLLP